MSLFSTKSNFTNATNSTKEESLATNERATTKNARRSFRRARSGRRRALVSFASSRCCVFPLSFSQRANWKCQNVTSSVFVPLLFVSSPREKTSADQRNRNARREVGEKMMRPKRAARKKTKSRRVPFLSNEFDALASKAFFVRVKSSSESWKARARVSGGKSIMGRLFPLTRTKKKRKKYLGRFFAPFLPLFWRSFFRTSFFFGLVFLFFGGKGNLLQSLGSWSFQ